MITRCPHCQTRFKISAEQLKVGAGKARCGQCQKVFSALSSLQEYHSNALSKNPLDHQVSTQASVESSIPTTSLPLHNTDALMSLKGKSYSPYSNHNQQPENPNVSRHTEVIRKDSHIDEPDTDYFKATVTHQQSRTIFWGLLANFLLILALLIQHLHFNSIHYSQNSLLGSTVKKLCQISQCPIALASAPKQLRVLDEIVILPHNELQDILNLKISFINQAEFIQRYPYLKVVFTDTLGQLIAERTFLPEEYLQEHFNQKRLQQGLKPQQQTDIILHLVDPMPKISLGFQVSFL